MSSPGLPSVGPYTCYTVPTGFIGLINDIVSLYIIICLMVGRTPLRPKRKLCNQRRTGMLCILCFGQTEINNIILTRGCLQEPGQAQALLWMTLEKIVLFPFLFVIVTGTALKHILANGGGGAGAGAGGEGDTHTVAEEFGSKAGQVVVATTPTSGHNGESRDAAIKAGTGSPDGYGPLELQNLPNYSTVDGQAIPFGAAEFGKADTQPLGVALQDLALNPPPIYIPGDHEGIDGSGPIRTPPDLESQVDENQETRSGEASEPLLPNVEKANGGSQRNHRRFGIIGLLLISASPAGFFVAQISMAIQSIRSGNRNTQVVGFVFFIIFLAGMTLLFFGATYVFWKVVRRVPRLSELHKSVPLQMAFIAPFVFSYLLAILYGDMNLGAMSGQLMGLGPTESTPGMILYWTYLVSTKLALFCH